MTAGEEERLAGAIDDSGPVRAAEQLRDVRRMIRTGRALNPEWQRDLVVDLTERIADRRASDEDVGLDEVG